jgi:hypothetical protein
MSGVIMFFDESYDKMEFLGNVAWGKLSGS